MDKIGTEIPQALEIVCFLCLKAVDGEAKLNVNRITSKCHTKNEPSFQKLVEFAENHLDVRDQKLIAYLEKNSDFATLTFCPHCDIFISVVCDLYEEMCRIAEKLEERVGQLAIFLEMSSNKKEGTKTGLFPKEIENFRAKLTHHCKGDSSPSPNNDNDGKEPHTSNIPIENECDEGEMVNRNQSNDEEDNTMGGNDSTDIKMEIDDSHGEEEMHEEVECDESEDSEKSNRNDFTLSSLAEDDSDSDFDEVELGDDRNDQDFECDSLSGSESGSNLSEGSDSDWEDGAHTKKVQTKLQKSSSSACRGGDKKRPYSCDICGRGITRSNYVAVHMEKVHNIPRPPPHEKPYSCKVCSNNFKSTGTLRNHMIRIHDMWVSFRNGNAPCKRRGTVPSSETTEASNSQESKTSLRKTKTTNSKVVTKKHLDLREVKKTQTVSTPGADGTFTCEHCQKVCRTRKGISKHLLDLHGIESADIIRPYECDICGQKFTRKENVKAHKNLRHRNPPPAKDTCKGSSDSVNKTRDPKQYACSLCPKGYDLKCSLELHMYQQHSQGLDFQCSECNKEFSTRRQLSYHMFETHKRDKKTLSFMSRVASAKENGTDDIVEDPCVICGEYIKSWALLRKHLEKHEKEISNAKKSLKCFFCWQSFAHEQSIWAHLQSSQYHDYTVIEFPCDHPDHLGLSQWAYKTLGELEKHFQTEHSESRVIKCSDCGWKCLDNNMMDLHRLVHLPRTQDRKHQCPVCPNLFLHAETLRNHYNTTHGVSLKLYRCHICTWGFPTRNGHTLHVKTHTDGNAVPADQQNEKQEEFVCSECPKSYPTAIQLRDHKRCFHVIRQCQECGIMIPKVKLYYHMSKVHGGERRHLCQSCGKKFRTSGQLKKHMASHGEFRYACQYCGKGYAVGKLLRRHIRREHKSEDVNQ